MFKVLGLIWFVLAGVSVRPSAGGAADAVLPPQMHLLAEQEGIWNVTFQTLDADQQWQTSRCTATMRMVLGGAAQAVDFEGTLNGMKYLGTGLTCFDRETGTWQSTWADNQGARITLYQGTWKGKDFILEGIDRAQGPANVLAPDQLQRRPQTLRMDDGHFHGPARLPHHRPSHL